MVRSAGGKSGDVVETIVGVNRDGGFDRRSWWGSAACSWSCCATFRLSWPRFTRSARAMIGRLKAAKLLTGFRGRAASDVEALSVCSSGWQPCAARWATGRFARPEPGHGAAGRGRRTHCGHRDAGGSGTALRGNRLILMEKSR
ncbi:MAG: hypothetical protein ACLSHC_04795 [Bilophila wadsworthia]